MSDHGILDKIHDAMQDQKKNWPVWAVGETEYYWMTDNTVICCGDHATVFQCKVCEDIVECEFHNNIDEPHCKESNE